MKQSLIKRMTLLAAVLIGTVQAATVNECTVDGVTYRYTVSNEEAELYGLSSRSIAGALIIPSSLDSYPLTSIRSSAFSGYNSLTSVTIPASVKSIGKMAFYGCYRLTSAEISEGVESIGTNAFNGCRSLTSVTIPASVKSIGIGAFYGCKQLASVEISEGVENIGGSAFYGCTNLGCTNLMTVMTIPSSVKSIGVNAFGHCGIQEFKVNEGNEVYCAIDGVLFSNDKTKLVAYPCGRESEYEIPDGVVSIESGSFRGCKGLTSVVIPSSVTNIGAYAFAETAVVANDEDGIAIVNGWVIGSNDSCPTDVVLPAGTKGIVGGAFCDCSSLKSIKIPEGITEISYDAFSACTNLEEVSIPKSVTSIDDSAFEGCINLKSAIIPEGVTSIGLAFVDCTNLTSVTFMGPPPTCECLLEMLEYDYSPDTKGYYPAKYAAEWKAVLDEEGKWNGIEMKQIEDVVFPEVTTKEEIAAAFEGVKDSRLAANITNVTEYATFKTWMDDVAKGDVEVRQKVKDSKLAWFAYALDLSALPEEAPTNVVIDTINLSSASAESWNLSLSVGDKLKIGSEASAADLGTVFAVEGAADLSEAFSTDNVTTTFAAAEDGRLAIQVTPPEGQKQFFIRVKMTP